MNTVKILVRVPPDVKEWLAEHALYNGATLGAEVSRACRQAMERERRAAAEKDRGTAIAAE